MPIAALAADRLLVLVEYGRKVGTKVGTTGFGYNLIHCLSWLNSDFEAGIWTYQSGTSGGTRTHTLVKEADFESAASTNSATLAISRNRSEKRAEP